MSFKDLKRGNPEQIMFPDLVRVRGNEVPGWSTYSMRGQSTSIDAGGFQSMAEWPDITFPAAPFQLAVASENANDTFGGSGAMVVAVRGLDLNFEFRNEVLVLAGQTPVVSAFTDWFRVNEIVCIRAGSADRNEGRITAGRANDTWSGGVPDTDRYGVVGVGWSTGAWGQYTVPAGYKAYPFQLQGSLDTRREMDIILEWKRTDFPWFRIVQAWGISGVQIADQIQVGEFLTAGTDVQFKAQKTTGAGPDGVAWFALNLLLQEE